MSKRQAKNKKNPLPSPMAPAASPAPVAAPAPLTASQALSPAPNGKKERTDRLQNVALILEGIVLVATLAVAIYAANISHKAERSAEKQAEAAVEANKLQKDAIDRATGRIKADIIVVKFFPTSNDVPAKMYQPFMFEVGTERIKFIHMNELNDFIVLNPYIIVKNIGDEPVDTIRIETRFSFGMVNQVGQPLDPDHRAPLVLKQIEREDYPLSDPFNKNEYIKISVSRGILDMIMQSQDPKQQDRKHMATFKFTCYGRIVNGSMFNSGSQNIGFRQSLSWIPAGFPAEACRTYEERMQPAPELLHPDAIRRLKLE